MKTRRISTKEVIATAVNYDMAEIEEYRYQSTRTTLPVYAIGDHYYCAPRIAGARPPRGWKWSEFGTFCGVKVYRAGTELTD